MSKIQRCLSDALLARFIVALGRNSVTVEMPEIYVGMRDTPIYETRVATVFAGGVRAMDAANDITAIIEERDALKAELERCKDADRAKVKCVGGKVTVSRNGAVKIKGGNVEISGPVQVEGVTA
jgi:hypothetical protein